MPLTKIRCERFTAFEEISVDLSPGVNVFVGANGTGKTHLMKVAYAACDVSKTKLDFAEKLVRVFLPSGRSLARLVKCGEGGLDATVGVHREDCALSALFSARSPAEIFGVSDWSARPIESVYIPVKEMLSNAPGFYSLYNQREIHFEEIYSDILDRAYRPPLREPIPEERKKFLDSLQQVINGKVTIKDEEFFLKSEHGAIEFTLLAEGMRKLGLLWLLIQNGTLLEGSVLFWDEPEANLNPKLYGVLMDILLELQRSGVQIFLATHDYVILKELDLRTKPGDKILYHSLFRGDDGEIECQSTNRYLDIHPNAIAEAFDNLYDREVERSWRGAAQ